MNKTIPIKPMRPITPAVSPGAGAPNAELGSCASSEPFALRVLGDSMAPEFPHGVIIIVDPTGLVTHGAYVVAKVDEEHLFRQVNIDADGQWTLVALQEDQRPIPIAGPQNVVGVVVQRAGSRRSQHKRYD
jgi:DNA polymerase V